MPDGATDPRPRFGAGSVETGDGHWRIRVGARAMCSSRAVRHSRVGEGAWDPVMMIEAAAASTVNLAMMHGCRSFFVFGWFRAPEEGYGPRCY